MNGFQAELENFEDDGIALIGSSTDSYFSHNAWFGDREIFPKEITHPVLGDTNHAVSKAFGVHKDDLGVSFRGTVIVDDQGIVRSVAVNDLGTGRSPKEALRTAQALKSGGLCGADWSKGDDFVA
ncbi:MAG: redoxin domain-containing protein [Planctomycetota bacterium]